MQVTLLTSNLSCGHPTPLFPDHESAIPQTQENRPGSMGQDDTSHVALLYNLNSVLLGRAVGIGYMFLSSLAVFDTFSQHKLKIST